MMGAIEDLEEHISRVLWQHDTRGEKAMSDKYRGMSRAVFEALEACPTHALVEVDRFGRVILAAGSDERS